MYRVWTPRDREFINGGRGIHVEKFEQGFRGTTYGDAVRRPPAPEAVNQSVRGGPRVSGRDKQVIAREQGEDDRIRSLISGGRWCWVLREGSAEGDVERFPVPTRHKRVLTVRLVEAAIWRKGG